MPGPRSPPPRSGPARSTICSTWPIPKSSSTPGASAEFRARFRADMAREGLPALHARLAAIDPEAAAEIRLNDRVRIERALEVHALSGRRLSELQREHAFAEERYPARIVYLV